jgi:exopolysaccharide production protein ExoQ
MLATREYPILDRLNTWVLLCPLLFVAVITTFSFEPSSQNDALSSVGGAMGGGGSPGGSLMNQLKYGLIWFIFLAILVPVYKHIIRLFIRNKLMLLLCFLPLLSTIWSQDPGKTARAGLSVVLSSAFAAYLSVKFTPARLMRLLMLLGWVALIVSLFLAVFMPQYGLNHRSGSAGEWEGMFPGKNVCAMQLFFLLFPAIYLEPVNDLERIGRFLYIGLALGEIAMTRSATAIIMLVALALYVIITRLVFKLRSQDSIPVALIAGTTVIGIAATAFQYRNVIFALVGKDPTLTGRTSIWGAILVSVMKQPLLGYGYGSFWTSLTGESANVILAIGWVMGYAHNGFLQILLDVGWLGLILLLVVTAGTFRAAFKCFVLHRTAAVQWYIGVLCFVLLYNMDEASLLSTFNLSWVMFLVCSFNLRELAREPSARTELAVAA